MSDPVPNLDPKEATEARLCAYLEGELTPTERVEIEQHLAANPQHRQLLVELGQTREWMRAIPRETSPVDLGEVFQDHVERSMLLNASEDEAGRGTFNRWPQYALVAAITALTLGLGAVLVAILKNPNSGNATVAMQSSASTASRTMTHAPATTSVEVVGSKLDMPPPGAASISAAAPAPDLKSEPVLPLEVSNTARHRTLAAKALDIDRPDADTLKSRLSQAGVRVPTDQKMVCFVVTADAPAAAMDQVHGFFDRHQIAFDASPADKAQAPRFIAANRSNDAAKNNIQMVGRDEEALAPRGVVTPGSPTPSNLVTPSTVASDATMPNRRNNNSVDNAGTNNYARQQDQFAQNQAVDQQKLQNRNNDQVAGNSNALSRNSAGQGREDQRQGTRAPDRKVDPATTNDPVAASPHATNSSVEKSKGADLSPASPPMVTPSAAVPALPGEVIYTAHGVTPLQVELLNASLLADNLKQTVQRVTVSAGQVDVPAAEAKVTSAISKGQTLTVTIAELTGPGIEKVNVVRVGDDGNIALPMIDALPALGLTSVELQQKVAEKYREANLIPTATVRVVVAGAPPSTQAATQPASFAQQAQLGQFARDTGTKEQALAAPATQSTVHTLPATRPAIDALLVDVVVIVQPSKYPVPTITPVAPANAK